MSEVNKAVNAATGNITTKTILPGFAKKSSTAGFVCPEGPCIMVDKLDELAKAVDDDVTKGNDVMT